MKYRIHVEEGPLLLDIDLAGQVPPWRPGTGYMYLGEQDDHFFAWLPNRRRCRTRVLIAALSSGRVRP